MLFAAQINQRLLPSSPLFLRVQEPRIAVNGRRRGERRADTVDPKPHNHRRPFPLPPPSFCLQSHARTYNIHTSIRSNCCCLFPPSVAPPFRLLHFACGGGSFAHVRRNNERIGREGGGADAAFPRIEHLKKVVVVYTYVVVGLGLRGRRRGNILTSAGQRKQMICLRNIPHLNNKHEGGMAK